MSDLVEVILVQLPDEAGEVAMFEVLGEDGFGELLILRYVNKLPRSQWYGLD